MHTYLTELKSTNYRTQIALKSRVYCRILHSEVIKDGFVLSDSNCPKFSSKIILHTNHILIKVVSFRRPNVTDHREKALLKKLKN